MFSIGEFSKITGWTVKTLRFYHEQGVLAPSYIDEETGYRYYDETRSRPPASSRHCGVWISR